MIDAQLQRDLNQAINAIRGISTVISKEAQGQLKEAATPLMLAIKAAAPKGTKVHTRYVSHGGKGRAARGLGHVAATYKPGNLKRSYRVLRFRRAKLAVFVGVKLGGKVDGYYSAMVRAGSQNVDGTSREANDYVEKAVSSMSASVLRDSINRINRIIGKYWVSVTFGSKKIGGEFKSGSLQGYAKAKGRE